MFRHCRKCDKEGKIYSKDTDGRITYTYCDCYKKYLRQQKLKAKLRVSGLYEGEQDLEYLNNLSFDKYVGEDANNNIPKLRRFVSEFGTKYHKAHMFFYGPQGCQKTTLAKTILMNLAKEGFRVFYCNSQDFFNACKNADYGFEGECEEAKAFMEQFYSADCVVLDEFDSDKILEYSSGAKSKVSIAPMKKRLEVLRKSTIFISNKTVSELKEDPKFGATYGDLIDRETFQSQFTFKDNFISNNINIESIWD